jgi:hypothetical protein
MSQQDDTVSLTELLFERTELQHDYIAFSRAYDVIKRRVLESNEAQLSRVPLLHTWSGTRAVCGSLELAIKFIQLSMEAIDSQIEEVQNKEHPKSKA